MNIPMEVDTGQLCPFISDDAQKKCYRQAKAKLNSTAVILHTYTAEAITVLGVTLVQVKYINTHELCVVEVSRPSLLGHAWLENMRPDWQSLRVECD